MDKLDPFLFQEEHFTAIISPTPEDVLMKKKKNVTSADSSTSQLLCVKVEWHVTGQNVCTNTQTLEESGTLF